MLKVLLKKQLMEINQFYFRNKKTGQRKSKVNTVLSIGLFVILFAFLGFAFYGLSMTLGQAFLVTDGVGEMEWLYFAIMGLMAFFLSIVGSVFQTYSSLYQAKDNDLLLSMPIKPINILFSRMMGVVLTGLLYSSLVWIPAALYYAIAKPGFPFLLPLLQLPAIVFFSSTVTCFLGWLIALISSRLKKKSFVTVIFSLLFFSAYMLLANRFNGIVQSIIANSSQIAITIKTWFFPMYLLGIGAAGNVWGLLGFWGISVGLLSLCIFIMSVSFMKIVTTNQGTNSSKRKVGKNRQRSIEGALLHREWKRFTSSATYMLNTGCGVIFMILLAAVVLIKQKELVLFLQMADKMLPGIQRFFPVALLVIMMFMISTNPVSAPSISLEGKTLPMIRSLPVSTQSVFVAKRRLHFFFNLPAMLITLILVGIALRLPIHILLMAMIPSACYIWFFADLGIVLNLKHVNLNWTNETVPVKQGVSVTLSMFGGWAIAIVIGVGAFFSINLIPSWLYMLLITILLFIFILIEEKWLAHKGKKLFEQL